MAGVPGEEGGGVEGGKGGGAGLGREGGHVSGVRLGWLVRARGEGTGHGAGGRVLGVGEGEGSRGGWVVEEGEEGGVRGSVSPISSSHYLSSMNGFWHQRREKQRPPTPPPALPPPNPPILPTPSAPPFQGAHPDPAGWGDKGGNRTGCKQGQGRGGSRERPVMRWKWKMVWGVTAERRVGGDEGATQSPLVPTPSAAWPGVVVGLPELP